MSPTRLRSIAAGGAILALTACASGGTLPGVTPSGPDGMPLAWFAERWGPFDPALNGGNGDGRRGPLTVVDGTQVDGRARSDTGVNPALAAIDPEDVERIEVLKCHSGAWRFGEAAEFGMIMIFTRRYDGPMPVRDAYDPSHCG